MDLFGARVWGGGCWSGVGHCRVVSSGWQWVAVGSKGRGSVTVTDLGDILKEREILLP